MLVADSHRILLYEGAIDIKFWGNLYSWYAHLLGWHGRDLAVMFGERFQWIDKLPFEYISQSN